MRTEPEESSYGEITQPKCQPWDRLETETDAQWAAFSAFLRLEKRVGSENSKHKRRFQVDLIRDPDRDPLLRNTTEATICRWATQNNWESRSKEFDRWREHGALHIRELEVRRKMAKLLRADAEDLRSLGLDGIKAHKPGNLAEAIKVYKLGIEVSEAADKLDSPVAADKKRILIEEASTLLGSLIKAFGASRELRTDPVGTTCGGPGGSEPAVKGTISAVEPTGESEPHREILALPGRSEGVHP